MLDIKCEISTVCNGHLKGTWHTTHCGGAAVLGEIGVFLAPELYFISYWCQLYASCLQAVTKCSAKRCSHFFYLIKCRQKCLRNMLLAWGQLLLRRTFHIACIGPLTRSPFNASHSAWQLLTFERDEHALFSANIGKRFLRRRTVFPARELGSVL